jgi:uncharacterized membrane protein
VASLVKPPTRSKTGPVVAILVGAAALLLALVIYMAAANAFEPLALLTFFKIYLGVFVAAALGIAGLTLVLIGATAVGMRLALRSADAKASNTAY